MVIFSRRGKSKALVIALVSGVMVLYLHNLSSYMYRQQLCADSTSETPTPTPPSTPTTTTMPETHEWERKGIPKTIHQVWSDEIIPTDFVDHMKKLVEINPPPEWKYYFWTQKLGRKLIERKYPSLSKFYEVSGHVQKANIIRLLAIHQFGGAYFDLDTVAIKPLAPYFENETCVITEEPPEHYIDKDSIIRPEFITNNVLFCKPAHPFYDALIRQLEKQPLKCLTTHQCSGPRFVSHVFTELRKKRENFDILPKLENYELFQDKCSNEYKGTPNKVCYGGKYDNAEIWRREMCDDWKRRGGIDRGISKLAYTYHTWYHFAMHKNIKKDPKVTISSIVPHVLFYE